MLLKHVQEIIASYMLNQISVVRFLYFEFCTDVFDFFFSLSHIHIFFTSHGFSLTLFLSVLPNGVLHKFKHRFFLCLIQSFG